MKRLLVLMAIIALPVGGAMAQSQNPTVIYQGHEIEIDPDVGPVQGCISKVVTTETIDETTVTSEGFIVAFNTDKWIVTGVFTYVPQAGANGSHVNDCWHLEWDAN